MANPLIHRPLDDLKLAAQVLAGGDGAVDVTMTQLAPMGMLNLRLDPNSPAKTAAEKALGTDIPMASNTQSLNGTVWWLSPDEWMVTAADRDSASKLSGKLTTALAGHHHSLVDVSHQFEGFRISGPLARDLLAHICTLDLHPRVLKGGSVIQTVAAHCTITLVVNADASAFDIHTRRSFVTYIWQRLVDAAADMDLRIEPIA